jgi:hypothetical protein
MHLLGWALKRRWDCRWLADFRDGWTFEPHRAEAALPVRRGLERWLERLVVQNADWLTAATRPLVADLRQRFPAAASRLFFLPSGFEQWGSQSPSSSAATGEAPFTQADDAQFRLVYTGRLALSRASITTDTLREGLLQAVRADPDLARRFRLVLVGDYTAAERRGLAPLAPWLELHGPCSPHQAQRLAATATMLLLVTPPGLCSIATRKLFDYLAVCRPIFALAEDNEASRVLTETRAGICVPPHRPDRIATALTHCFASWKAGRLDAEVPCSGNGLYLAEPHYRRVLGNIIQAIHAAAVSSLAGPRGGDRSRGGRSLDTDASCTDSLVCERTR